jgi:hypothetical protein
VGCEAAPAHGCRQADEFRGHKLRKGRWQPVLLRVSAHAVERVDPASGLVKWRLDYRHMASPAGEALVAGWAGRA